MLSKLIEQRGGPDQAPRWMVVTRFIGRVVVNLLMLGWLLFVSDLAMSGLFAIQSMGGAKKFWAYVLAMTCRSNGGCPSHLMPSMELGIALGFLLGAALLTWTLWPWERPDVMTLARRVLTWIERMNHHA